MPSATPTTRLDPGSAPHLLLGRYRVLEERGHGGFGAVSVCWDPRLMRRVAIKVIPLHPGVSPADAGRAVTGVARGRSARRASQASRQLRLLSRDGSPASDARVGAPGGAWGPDGDPATRAYDSAGADAPDVLRRRQADALMRAALAETRTASMLAHANIVSMLDFESDDDFAYIIMEYVEGASLAELLDATEDGVLTFDEAAAVAEGVGDALQYAHDNGVLHLDIKPDNILVDGSGRVRLADFGMATLSSATGYGGATGGTIGYMPPEQITGARVGIRTDVFAFAAVMYEALTGVRPFVAATPEESLDLVQSVLPDPCALNESLSPVAADALIAALSPDPAGRPADVEEFVAELRRGLGSPRVGRRSLASFVADVTNDEAADDADQAGVDEGDAVDEVADGGGAPETDDELGVLSRPFPGLAAWALRVLAALSCGVLACLSMLALSGALAGSGDAAGDGLAGGVTSVVSLTGALGDAAGADAPLVTSVVVGVLVGAIGLAAPQLASAIALLALVAACLARHLWACAPLVLAAGVAWWVVTARHAPLTCGSALAGTLGAPAAGHVGGGAPALVAGYLLSPGRAALSAVVSLVVAVSLTALAGGATLGDVDPSRLALTTASTASSSFLALVRDPATALSGCAWAAASAALAGIAHRGGRMRCYLGCFCALAIMLALRLVVARVENAGVWTPLSADDLAGSVSSFILVCGIVFLFGTPRSLFAGEDRIADDEGPRREDH